jgi:hypothetical protein
MLALSIQQKGKFLKKLKTTHGNVSKAATGIGIGRSTAYLHKSKDADFSAAWDDILASVYDEMEAELYRRAVVGEVDREGIRKKSDRLLEFALKGNRAEKFRERYDVNQHVTGSLDVSIQHTIDQVYGDDAGAIDLTPIPDDTQSEDPESPDLDAGTDSDS